MAQLPDEVKRACKVLNISREQVMAYRVYPDRVVIIEGPVGFKRIVPFERMEEFEAEKKAEVAAKVAAEREAKGKTGREK